MVLSMFTACNNSGSGSGTNSGSDSTNGEKNKLVLGLDDSFPPMGFRDEDNNIVGFDIDLAQAVCDKMGVELVVQPIAWDSKEMELNLSLIHI